MTMRRLLALVCLGIAAARPTVRELKNLAEFDKLLAHHAENTGLPVVVDFYSDSCGPCRMIAPVFKKLAAEYKDRAVFAKVNVAYARDVSAKAQIRSMPTFHFYADGRKKNEFSGAGEMQLRQATDQIVASAASANAKLARGALLAFYEAHDSSKSEADVDKILKKCGSLAKAGGDCVGGAAKELAKKLEAKFGAAPKLVSRFDKKASDDAPPPRSRAKKAPSADKATTEELLAELAKRADGGDDVAAVGAEAMQNYLDEIAAEDEDDDEDEEEDDEALPLYRPQSNFAERVVIVGGGPGGLGAAVYAARAGLMPIVVAPPGGGQLLGKGVTIENYPGVLGDTGPGIVTKMQQHAAESGAVFYPHAVTRVDLQRRPFVVETPEANISAHTLIIATGADSRWLGVEGESEFKGGGVSSCATCDGFLYRDRDVAVIGGGDTAMEDALVLARTSAKVTVVHRRDAFRASKAMATRVLEHPKIEVLWNATVASFSGTHEELEMEDEVKDIATLTRVHLTSTASGEASALDVAAAFVAIGHDPNTKLFADQLVVKPSGYLELAGSKFATELSVPGVFAAGDVADPVYRQAITSAGSGAMAALDAERYLSEHGIGDDSEQFNDDLMAELMADFQNGSADDGAHNAYDDASSENILKYANAKADL
jgi:thioredoxin-disulfide reductase/thioredoxin